MVRTAETDPTLARLVAADPLEEEAEAAMVPNLSTREILHLLADWL